MQQEEGGRQQQLPQKQQQQQQHEPENVRVMTGFRVLGVVVEVWVTWWVLKPAVRIQGSLSSEIERVGEAQECCYGLSSERQMQQGGGSEPLLLQKQHQQQQQEKVRRGSIM